MEFGIETALGDLTLFLATVSCAFKRQFIPRYQDRKIRKVKKHGLICSCRKFVFYCVHGIDMGCEHYVPLFPIFEAL